jgi:putative membrane protein
MAAAALSNPAFIHYAVEDNNAGIKFGALAEQRGSTPEIRQLGQMVRTDNEAARASTTEAAKAAGVTAPMPARMTGNAVYVYERLSKLSGPAFDKAFAQAVVDARQKDVPVFTDKAQGTGKVSQLAKDQLPAMQKELDTAQTLAAKP